MSHIYANYAEMKSSHQLSDEQYLAFEKGINVNYDADTLKVLPNQRLKSLFRNLNALSLDDEDDDDNDDDLDD